MWDFLQIDVFSPRAGLGNPLAVVIDDGRLTATQMQAIAAWTNLAETTFLQPPTTPGASYKVRIFTTRQEIAFAGHPSIGTAHAALAIGRAPAGDGMLVQECAAGLLPIRVVTQAETTTISVRVPRSHMVRSATRDDSLLTSILSDRQLGRAPPALVEGGRRWWLAELSDEAQVRSMQPDLLGIATLARESASLGLCVFARSPGQDYDLVVRAFPLGVGINEDPASGAANAAIAAYLEESGHLGELGDTYVASQGRELGRDARLTLHIDGDRQVWVGGRCITVLSGRLDW